MNVFIDLPFVHGQAGHNDWVRSLVFHPDGKFLLSASDDKTIRAWDFDIPVVIKYIAEPHMHSMPAVTLHPSSTSQLTLFLEVLLTVP